MVVVVDFFMWGVKDVGEEIGGFEWYDILNRYLWYCDDFKVFG